MISHQGVDRREVLGRRWPDLLMKSLEQEAPTWVMDLTTPQTLRDAVEALSRCA
jgi:hypothetical protein